MPYNIHCMEWINFPSTKLSFLCGSAGKESACIRETWIQFLGWEDPLEKERLPIPVFWPEEFHELYSPWGHKELEMTEWFSHFYQTEKCYPQENWEK